MEVAGTRIFLDATKEQQVLDLATYVAHLKGEPEGEFFKGIRTHVEGGNVKAAVRAVLAEMPGLLQNAPERELEGEINLGLALLRHVDADELPALVNALVVAFVNAKGPKPSMMLRVLTNLYNNLELNSPVRLSVYRGIVQIAAQHARLSFVAPHLPNLEAWTKQWSITDQQKVELYRLMHDQFVAGNLRLEGHKVMVLLLKSLDASNAEQVKKFGSQAIAEAINIPGFFNFDELLQIAAIQQLQKEKVHELLSLFTKGNLAGYDAFVAANGALLSSLAINQALSKEKMRLIATAAVCAAHVGGEVSYAEVAKAISVDVAEVERWLIDTVRYHLADAKLDQLKHTILVSGATHRTFDAKQWQELNSRLAAWRSSVSSVLQVVQNAKLIAQSQTAA